MPQLATTGRKDPCSCGSGKTYECCCLREDLQAVDTVDVSIGWEETETVPTDTFLDRMISSDELQKLCGLSREEMYYTVRSLSRFAEFQGFAEIDGSTRKDGYRMPSIRKTAFLDEWIRFGGLDEQPT